MQECDTLVEVALEQELQKGPLKHGWEATHRSGHLICSECKLATSAIKVHAKY